MLMLSLVASKTATASVAPLSGPPAPKVLPPPPHETIIAERDTAQSPNVQTFIDYAPGLHSLALSSDHERRTSRGRYSGTIVHR